MLTMMCTREKGKHDGDRRVYELNAEKSTQLSYIIMKLYEEFSSQANSLYVIVHIEIHKSTMLAVCVMVVLLCFALLSCLLHSVFPLLSFPSLFRPFFSINSSRFLLVGLFFRSLHSSIHIIYIYIFVLTVFSSSLHSACIMPLFLAFHLLFEFNEAHVILMN